MRIKCIVASYPSLTQGKVYETLTDAEAKAYCVLARLPFDPVTYYYIKNDAGIEGGWGKTRFVPELQVPPALAQQVAKYVKYNPQETFCLKPIVKLPKRSPCECGAHKCGSNVHSDWCPENKGLYKAAAPDIVAQVRAGKRP